MKTGENESKVDYRSRLNSVFHYIDDNLDAKLSLQMIAEKACFSPYYFHRIFKHITGERLNEFITRRRIERSVVDLLHTKYSISEIAHAAGFSDNSAFTKAFKKFYGISPSEFKNQNPNKFVKIRPLKSKIGQNYPNAEEYVCIIQHLKNWIDMHAKIDVKKISRQAYVYSTCIGPNELPAAFQKLMNWALSNGYMNAENKLMTVYEDSLKVTEEAKARFRACLHVENGVESEFEMDNIPSGKYLVGRFEIVLDDFEKSWTGLYFWMHENGLERAPGASFEVYHNNFNEHPEKKVIADFYIPIK